MAFMHAELCRDDTLLYSALSYIEGGRFFFFFDTTVILLLVSYIYTLLPYLHCVRYIMYIFGYVLNKSCILLLLLLLLSSEEFWWAIYLPYMYMYMFSL